MEVNHIDLPGQEKDEGNKFWKDKDYLNASKSYSKALLAFNHLLRENLFKDEEQLIKMTNEIQLPCLLNLSACYLSLGYGYQNIVIHCTDALKIQENNVKALYRRAIALTNLDKFEEAKKDIEAALNIEPQNASLHRIDADLVKRKKAYKEKTKKIAKKVFEKEVTEVNKASDDSTVSETTVKSEKVVTKSKWWKCCRMCSRKNKIT